MILKRVQSEGRWWVPALLSGLLLAASFPRFDLDFLCWIGLIPLLLVAHRRPFVSGALTGLAFYLPTLSWLNIVMVRYGGMPWPAAVPLQTLLSAYLAIYFGLATWLACRLKSRLGWPMGLTLPWIWVALDWARNYMLTGFPWASLGYALEDRLLLIQSADVTGIYGITFLIVFSNAVLADWIHTYRDAKGGLTQPSWAVLLFLIVFVANAGYGYLRLEQDLPKQGDPLRVALIQGNIDQAVKWAPEYQARTIDRYVGLSRDAVAEGPLDLLIWPESATPFYYQDPSLLSQRVNLLPAQVKTSLLFGSPAYRREGTRIRYLNSAFLLGPEGQLLGRSDKAHLVPFGEYVPLASILTFVDKLVVGIGDFSPGTVTPLPMNGHSLGVLVCYESIFPELARNFVRKGAGVLVNITNDAWFGRSAAAWQHLAMARFRAIENRVWVLRSANTGISALIHPDGTVENPTSLFTTTWSGGTAYIREGGSLYTRFGDSLPLIASLVSIVGFVMSFRRLGSQ